MSLSKYIQQPQTDLFNELGIFFAFSNEQFDKGKKEGVIYVNLGAGVVCPKDNVQDFKTKHAAIVEQGIQADLAENGKEKIIRRELENYECYYLGDPTEAIEALEDYGITESDVLEIFSR